MPLWKILVTVMLYIDIIDTSSILPFEESRRLSRKKSLLGSNVAL